MKTQITKEYLPTLKSVLSKIDKNYKQNIREINSMGFVQLYLHLSDISEEMIDEMQGILNTKYSFLEDIKMVRHELSARGQSEQVINNN
jgi:hypothetical protein